VFTPEPVVIGMFHLVSSKGGGVFVSECAAAFKAVNNVVAAKTVSFFQFKAKQCVFMSDQKGGVDHFQVASGSWSKPAQRAEN